MCYHRVKYCNLCPRAEILRGVDMNLKSSPLQSSYSLGLVFCYVELADANTWHAQFLHYQPGLRPQIDELTIPL